jgi:hypothetical protein
MIEEESTEASDTDAGAPVVEETQAPDTEPETPATPLAEQLSLEQMVESLAAPEEDAVEETVVAHEPAAGESEAEEPAAEESEADAPIAEETEIAASELPSEPIPARSRLGARLPFWILSGVWAAFAGTLTYLLWAASSTPFTAHPLYAVLTFGGLGLTVAGPLLVLVVWLLMRRASEPTLREGLVRAVFLRAAVATLSGNLLWWAALLALDMHRTGVLG